MGCGKPTNHTGSRNSGCVCDVVRAILDIQNQAVQDECSPCTSNCFLEPLGGIVSPVRSHADTRVFMLLTKDGTPFKAFFNNQQSCKSNKDKNSNNNNNNNNGGKNSKNDYCTSVFFRVEDMFDDCCATLRVLEPIDDNYGTADLLGDDGCCIDMGKLCDVTDWESTESCITVDLSCFCAVQCIADIDLGICD